MQSGLLHVSDHASVYLYSRAPTRLRWPCLVTSEAADMLTAMWPRIVFAGYAVLETILVEMHPSF